MITTADTEVGTDTVAELAAARSSSQSVELTAPDTEGTYHYGACVDAVQGESDKENNCSSPVQVTVQAPGAASPGHPDLMVALPSVSDGSPAAGARFTLSATVRNAGGAAAAAAMLRYYRSADATITTSDASVGTDDVGVLSASGTSEQSISLTAPSSPATYYYGACVDAVTDESDTTNNCSGSVTVTVSEPEESAPSVEISAEDDKEWAPVGDTVDLSARVLDDEGEEITGTTVRWSSSNTAVATVDSSGVMTAVGEGTVTLTATATVSSSSTQSSMARSGAAVVKSDQTVSGSVTMIVVKRAARIDLSPASLSFDSVGDYATLTATVYDEDDNVMRPTYWGWSSADRAVATASNRVISSQTQGFVQAIGEGTTTVSVSVNGSARGTASVTVTLPKARVEVSPIELTFEALGDTQTVTVRVLDENGDEDEDASFTWTTIFSPCCGFEPGDTIGTVHTARVDDGLEVTAGGTGNGRITITSEDVEPAFVLVRGVPGGEVAHACPGFGESGGRRDGHPEGVGHGRQRVRNQACRGQQGRTGGVLGDERFGRGDGGRRGWSSRPEHGRHRDGYRGRSRYGHDHGAPPWRRDWHGDDNGDRRQLIGRADCRATCSGRQYGGRPPSWAST